MADGSQAKIFIGDTLVLTSAMHRGHRIKIGDVELRFIFQVNESHEQLSSSSSDSDSSSEEEEEVAKRGAEKKVRLLLS